MPIHWPWHHAPASAPAPDEAAQPPAPDPHPPLLRLYDPLTGESETIDRGGQP